MDYYEVVSAMFFLKFQNCGTSMTAKCQHLLVLLDQVPQQKNEYDCGLFVLYFIKRFMEEAPERLKKKDLAMVINKCC